MTLAPLDAKEHAMELDLVNADRGRGPASLVPPPRFGYLLISAAVDPPRSPGPPRPRRSRRRQALLERLTALAPDVEGVDGVERVTVYRSVVVPPPQAYARDHARRIARYDVAVLVEASSPEAIPAVEAAEPVGRLLDAVQGAADDVHVLRARCAKSLGDVDKRADGLFLFNYFVAEEPDVALALWDELAGWYRHATGLDNSTLLVPLEPDDFVMVNHARWDRPLPRVFLGQVLRPSFRSFVLANLLVNRTGAMPILLRRA
jgi:hypothetical protein